MKIERLLHDEEWSEARKLIRAALRRSPDDHWLLTCLGLTFYEQQQYSRALVYAKKAHELAPNCPLVLWDLAGTLDMLHREEEAIVIYKSLIRRGVEGLAYGECGEGLTWARRLVNDCRYRISRCLSDVGDKRGAMQYLKSYIAGRESTRSAYDLRVAKKRLGQLQQS